MDSLLLDRFFEEPPPSPRDHRHPTERGQADFYRTRLTHSVEVAQLARAIAHNMIVEEPRLADSLTPELAEASALAHDLGHPPFGHAGEQTLDSCLLQVSRRARLTRRGALRFEANAQTFHILVAAEPKSPAYPGLNLTRGTLAGVMKYPFRQDSSNEKFIFTDDMQIGCWAVKGGGAILSSAMQKDGARPETSITCQILNWADDCAYSIHDIEDALQAQFLRAGDLRDPQFSRRVAAYYEQTHAAEQVPHLQLSEVRERLRELERKIRPRENGDERARRKQALRNILNDLIISVLVERCPGNRRPDFAWRLAVPDESRILTALCKAIIWEAVITDPRVAAMSTKGSEILQDLFHLLMDELIKKKSCALFPRHYRPIIEESMGKGELESARGVCNFLALLTDLDALRLHSLLRGSKYSSVFDLL
jgi:dGTPase